MNKKIIFTLLACVALFLSSCEKDNYAPPIDLQILSGEWIVSSYNTVDGEYHAEGWTLRTSNTNSNTPNRLLLMDDGFYDFVVDVPADPWKPLFGQDAAVVNQYIYIDDRFGPVIYEYDIGVILKDGKVTPEAITLPSGFKADKISFTIAFEDDGWEEYRVVGYRFSGFLEDHDYIYYEE